MRNLTSFIINRNNLIKISFCIFIIAYLFLFFYYHFYEMEITKVKDITPNHYNNLIKTYGEVRYYSKYKEFHFFVLEDQNKSINVAIFSIENLTLENNQKIFIKGIIGFYNSKIQIIGREVIFENSNK